VLLCLGKVFLESRDVSLIFAFLCHGILSAEKLALRASSLYT
jgi:hypothetical protein